MNINYQIIGKRIKIRREQIQMTQMELAEITELSVPYISYIETGKKKLSLGTLINIANALSISPNELLMDHLTVISDCGLYCIGVPCALCKLCKYSLVLCCCAESLPAVCSFLVYHISCCSGHLCPRKLDCRVV